jgi:predicted HNH restriction endonuclease
MNLVRDREAIHDLNRLLDARSDRLNQTSPDQLSPTVFVEALFGVRSRITPIQWAMLQAHFLAAEQVLSAKELALAAGGGDFRLANAQYGRLGSLLREFSPILRDLPGQKSHALAAFLAPDADHPYWRWSMHVPLVVALEKLGWFADAQAVGTPSELGSIGAQEGQLLQRFVWHRHRERSLRLAKLRQARALGDGRLVCEVPGCGFDFAKVYGALGDGYAEVHHRRPLAELESGQETTLSDLAVVCANCHRMIHRGGGCRPLDEILNQPGRAV